MRKPPRIGEREVRMAELYRSGYTLQQVGDEYGLTRERVRQLLAAQGITARDGGQRLQATVAAAKRAKAREARWRKRFGCSYAEKVRISSLGGTAAFDQQRSNARRRGIPWSLNLKEWWDVWGRSGHWDERGRKRGQYVMARFGDQDAYALGNVEIVTSSRNVRECRSRDKNGRPLELQGVHLRAGTKKPYVATYGHKTIGCFAAASDARDARDAYLATLGLAA